MFVSNRFQPRFHVHLALLSVSFAFVLTASPQALLADEPTSAQPIAVDEVNGSGALAVPLTTDAQLNATQLNPTRLKDKEGAGPTEQTSESSDGDAVARTAQKRRGNAGRLPQFFSGIVDSRQRQVIYEIRARAAIQLDALQQQLDALRQAEMVEMEAILTEAQREQLAALRMARTTASSTDGVKAVNGQRAKATSAPRSEANTAHAEESSSESVSR